MPPKKKPRLEPSGTATPQPEAAQASAISTPPLPRVPTTASEEELLKDPWTDSQEVALFKAVIRCKPTGIHKHFNMLSVASNFDTLTYPHTRIPGIWSKLGTLYDLDALDEREENYAKAIERESRARTEDDDVDLGAEPWTDEFSLDTDPDLFDLMMSRRFASEGASSPLSMPFLLDRPSEVSASPAPGRRGGRRGSRPSIAGSVRRQSQVAKAGARRGSGAATSDASPEELDEDDSEEEGTEHGDQTSHAGSSPPTRATRRAGRGRGRGASTRK